MEFNLAKHKAMTDAEDKYRKESEAPVECPECDELFSPDELELGLCGDCWKKRDAAETREER